MVPGMALSYSCAKHASSVELPALRNLTATGEAAILQR
jgi:hypothetical protein